MDKQLIRALLLVVICAAVGWAEEKAADAPDSTLIGGRLHYAAPQGDDWQRAENVNSDDAAAYARHDHHAAIAIQVLPADAEMIPQMGSAVVRSLREAHQKANQKILYGPKIEPDKRFALKIHEKYQAGDKVADELHLYRNVGPRVAMVTVNAWVTDDADAMKIHEIGEEVLASAKWSKSGKK
jgi:hypothetical protein